MKYIYLILSCSFMANTSIAMQQTSQAQAVQVMPRVHPWLLTFDNIECNDFCRIHGYDPKWYPADSYLGFTYLKGIMHAKKIAVSLRENESEAEEYAVDLIECFFANNFFSQAELSGPIAVSDLQKQFEKERSQYIILKSSKGSVALAPSVARILPFARVNQEMIIDCDIDDSTLLLFKYILYLYCHHIRCMKLDPQFHFNFHQRANDLLESWNRGFDSYQLEILASLAEIGDLMLATWMPSVKMSSKRTRRTIEVDPRLADLFKIHGLGFVHSTFSFADMIAFECLINAYGLNEAFKAPTRDHKDLALDICQWITERTEWIRRVVFNGKGEAEWKTLSQNERKSIYEMIKAHFEQARIAGVELGTDTNVRVPAIIAQFFPFLAVIVSGRFAKTNNRLVTAVECNRPTLVLFKQLICAYYHHCRELVQSGGLTVMDFNLTSNDHNAASLIAFFKEILHDAARDQEIDFSSLLSLSCHWELPSIYHAIIELLADQPDSKIEEMADAVSPQALPRLAMNIENAGFIMDLLLHHHTRKTPGIDGIISDCCERFAENIYSILGRYNSASIFRGALAEVMKQKLQIFHVIPNFQRIWNIQLEQRNERWEQRALLAWYNDEEAVFVFPNKRAVTYADSNFGDSKYYKHHDFSRREIFENRGYECFASNADDNLLIASTKTGTIEIVPYVYSEDQPIVIPSTAHGTVTGLSARRYDNLIHIVASYSENGSVVVYLVDRKTRNVKEMPAAPKDNLSEAARYNSTNHCQKLALDERYVCGVAEPGVLWVWENLEALTLKKVVTLPQQLSHLKITSLHIFNGKLYVGCGDGSVAVFDLKKICGDSTLPEMILSDANSIHCGNAASVMALLKDPQYIAVAYRQGWVVIWDLKTQKIVKKIRRNDAEVIWLSTKFSEDHRALDVIYDDGIVDRYFITESASIRDVLDVLENKLIG